MHSLRASIEDVTPLTVWTPLDLPSGPSSLLGCTNGDEVSNTLKLQKGFKKTITA